MIYSSIIVGLERPWEPVRGCARWFWEALKGKRCGVTGSLKIKSLNLLPVPAPNQCASQKRVETEVSTTVLRLTNCLEVDLQSKLPETTLVVRTVVVADTALGRRDRYRNPFAN